MKKAIGQTVRELKREVNKKVLKVPGIEQKVLDATNNEEWGPHGSLLADIAQASRNYHENLMIMAVIWKRINDTGKNWRHVYKALTVLEYLVANGSERVIEEIREHAHQITTLSNFQYIDSSGRDQGNNIRRKSQSLVLLVNDKERIKEVRQKAAANRDKGSSAKAEDHSLEGRLERKLSEQNVDAPPSYEEAVSQSPLHYERDGEISAASAPKGSSPKSDNPHQKTSAPTGSSLVSDNPIEATAAASTGTSENREVEAFDEFDPRGHLVSAPANNVEMDLLGSLSYSFSSNALALVPSASETTTSQGNANLESTASFALPPSASNNFNPVFEDPFGDSPFKAGPSTETAPSHPQTHQGLAPSLSSGPNTESVSNFRFGVSFSVPSANETKLLSMSPPSQETDILADILPPAPLPGTTSQQNFSAPPDAQFLSSFSASSGQMAPQSFFTQSGQHVQQDFSAVTSQPAAQSFSAPGGQPLQPPPSVPTSQHAQQPFPSHTDQSAQSVSHIYGGFPSLAAGSMTQEASSAMFPQSQGGHMNQTYEQGSMPLIPLHTAPQASTGQSANYLSSQSPIDQASQFNSGNLSGQSFNHQPLGQGVHASQNAVSQPPKDKFETKSTVWADTLSRGLVNLNISGPKINPLADIGVDFDAINRREKRMEKPTTTTVTSTVTMGKAMGSGSGMGRAGVGALRPPPNPMMGPGVGMAHMGMGGYGGMNVPMGMVQMQPPPFGFPPGSNMPGNYNSMMRRGGYPQHPYSGGGYR
uniref:ENTH domain-containing protein n=1 Tax=Glycine max TaxID=3847 RepID=K7LM85_SOYBN